LLQAALAFKLQKCQRLLNRKRVSKSIKDGSIGFIILLGPLNEHHAIIICRETRTLWWSNVNKNFTVIFL